VPVHADVEASVDEAVIDGEVIAANETGRPQFYDLLRGTSSPCYIAFDLVWLNGADLRPLPLYERRRALQGMLPRDRRFFTDRIVAERNNGGDMVEATIRMVDPNVPLTTVWATRGKVEGNDPERAGLGGESRAKNPEPPQSKHSVRAGEVSGLLRRFTELAHCLSELRPHATDVTNLCCAKFLRILRS
jgi:hypothetical protein